MRNTNIDFVGKKKIFALISLSLLVIGIVCNIIFGTQMDIQFTGGTIVKYSYTGDVDKKEMQEVLRSYTNGQENYTFAYDVVTTTSDNNPNNVSVLLPANENLSTQDMEHMLAALQEKFPAANFHQLESSTVEATMGHEFFGKCMVAIALASVLMLVYVAIRFRKIGGWSAGLLALLALVHDVMIAYFVFVIFGLKLNDNFVAVVLSVLGYSLNDTIVIYDRIRENRRVMGAKADLGDVVNRSINQSFSRSMNTALTTFIAVTCITVVALFYGLDSILTFSVPMMFAVISGCYSSICLAAPLWVALQRQMAKNRAKKAQKALTSKKSK